MAIIFICTHYPKLFKSISMLQTITELRDAGIHVIPLGYKDGKFIHPIYHDKFTGGMSENDLSELVK